jgi:hypothetical protein
MIALYRGSFIVKIFTPGASLGSKSGFLSCSTSVLGRGVLRPLQIASTCRTRPACDFACWDLVSHLAGSRTMTSDRQPLVCRIGYHKRTAAPE